MGWAVMREIAVEIPEYEKLYFSYEKPTKEYNWFARKFLHKSLQKDKLVWDLNKEEWFMKSSQELGISVESLKSMTPGNHINLPQKTERVSEIVRDRDLACHLREIILSRPSLNRSVSYCGYHGYYNFVVREVEREG